MTTVLAFRGVPVACGVRVVRVLTSAAQNLKRFKLDVRDFDDAPSRIGDSTSAPAFPRPAIP